MFCPPPESHDRHHIEPPGSGVWTWSGHHSHSQGSAGSAARTTRSLRQKKTKNNRQTQICADCDDVKDALKTGPHLHPAADVQLASCWPGGSWSHLHTPPQAAASASSARRRSWAPHLWSSSVPQPGLQRGDKQVHVKTPSTRPRPRRHGWRWTRWWWWFIYVPTRRREVVVWRSSQDISLV